MTKRLLGIACLAGILAGCTNQNTDQTEEMNELKVQVEQLALENEELVKTVEEERQVFDLALNEQANRDYAMIVSQEIEAYPLTLYKQASVDLDEDGTAEQIELYVNAEKTENGLFAWDDGQKWMLVVKDGEKTYPLFDDYVQLGTIDFSTTTFDEQPGIVMMMVQHSDRTVQKFTYDLHGNGYQKETFYKKENINNHYNEAASHAFFKDAFTLMDHAFTTKTLTVLEANEPSLQDDHERRLIIELILADLYNANRLLEMATELNHALNVSLSGAIDLLYEMVNQPPTAEQRKELTAIHELFKEIEADDLIMKEENQIHPDIAEKLKRLDFIVDEK
ncbi:MAG: hypothetical protein ABS942_07610 [Solibacillus sp.]|uniref:hypothetical protein n=1 Tax=Solibacillus sp. TaxID=1909654 RepID=UPI0033163F46